MADEQPKRFKGAKHLEAGYRAGYEDGYKLGMEDALRVKDAEQRRELDIQRGLAALRMEQQAKPKRTRRTKALVENQLAGLAAAEKANGL